MITLFIQEPQSTPCCFFPSWGSLSAIDFPGVIREAEAFQWTSAEGHLPWRAIRKNCLTLAVWFHDHDHHGGGGGDDDDDDGDGDNDDDDDDGGGDGDGDGVGVGDGDGDDDDDDDDDDEWWMMNDE